MKALYYAAPRWFCFVCGSILTGAVLADGLAGLAYGLVACLFISPAARLERS